MTDSFLWAIQPESSDSGGNDCIHYRRIGDIYFH